MEPIPHIVRQRMQAAARPEVHPDPDVLSALAEKALNEPERDEILLHLAVCADCREILSLAQPQVELEYAAAAAAPDRPRGGWLQGSWLRWGAAAACVVVVSAAVLLRYQSRGRLASYSASPQAPPSSVAREASENRALDQLAATSGEADKLTDLKQDSRRERAALDFQDGSELAVKQQAARDLAKPGTIPKKKLAQPATEEPVGSMFGAARAKGSMGGAAGAAAAAPVFSARVVGGELNKDEARRDASQPQASSETVTVTAGAPPQITESVEVNTAPAAAQPRTAESGRMMTDYATISVEPQSEVMLQKAANVVTPRWTLSSDGHMLMRSVDSGKSWQTIPVADHVVFRAISAVGPEIWAGGSGGALYHSPDAGQHWAHVKPAANGQTLSADIVGVEFTDAQHGKLTTDNREIWITTDAGRSWQKR